ncbi:hypothetical protein HRH25_17295, partial [Flavisolibacter sp. BT320]|nr:hypothetical protein [Flavisolibacter longurius]
MKKLCAVLALIMLINLANATDYYFSSTIGDDSRSSAEAQNPNTPWKTIQKLNAFFPNLKPGDNVYFKRGDVFNGTIRVNRSGSSGAPITFSAYGSGAKPVINGLTAISNWVNIGNGIWEGISSNTTGSAVSSSSAVLNTTSVATLENSFNTSSAATLGGLNFKYYEGSWSSLPDFGSLTPVATGTSANVNLDQRKRNDNFAFLWEGKITVPAAGTYYFETVSDDGSKLYIGKYGHYTTPVVDNNGLHAEQYKGGYYTFPSAGTYDIAITFFERDGGETMRVFWGNPAAGIPLRTPIPDAAFSGGGTTADINPAPSVGGGSGLNFKYYEGSWSSLPDFGSLTPVATGTSANVNLDQRKRNDNF